MLCLETQVGVKYMGFSSLSKKLLDEIFVYDPELGTLTYKVDRRGCVAGQSATKCQTDGRIIVRFNGHHYSSARVAYIIATGTVPGAVTSIDGNRENIRFSNLTPRQGKYIRTPAKRAGYIPPPKIDYPPLETDRRIKRLANGKIRVVRPPMPVAHSLGDPPPARSALAGYVPPY